MTKRRGRPQSSKTLNPPSQEAPPGDGKGFFACYLLTSLNPRYKGHTYIGFTVNPRRRIRQHNGEIVSGAWRTKRKRPWEMVLCICGFPTNVSALQFEWAWQHPVESLAVRKAAATFKSLSGLANKIKLAFTMLTLPSWQGMNMTVNFFSTKYMKHSAGCPSLPEHMKVQVCSMDELPCYAERIDGLSENEDDCFGEEECNNSTSNSDSVPDTFDGSVAHPSTQNKESGEREPCPSFASQDKSQQFGSIMSQMIIEDGDFMSSTDKKSVESRQPDCIQSGANGSQELRSNSSIPGEDDIIDLSTPSPSCRSFSDSKKRRVSCVHTDFIDLTNSPSFIQL